MVQKSAVIFEITKNERVYQFIIPVGAPFGEVFDTAFELLATSENLSKQAVEAAKKAFDEAKAKETSEEPKAEEVKAELN